MKETKYTVVQHSGFGYGFNSTFALAVESRTLDTLADVRKVEKAGGLVFDDYLAAEDFCERANYFRSQSGLVPRVEGNFSDQEIDGLRIYLPKRVTVDDAIAMFTTEKANIEAEQAQHQRERSAYGGIIGALPEDDQDMILKVRLNEIDTFLNLLQDMKVGH